MASLPASYPTLSLHLTDPAVTPLISSAPSSHSGQQSTSSSPSLPSIIRSPRFAALTNLTTASLTVYSSAARLGLGLPQRMIIDTAKQGPVILHSFLNPELPRAKADVEVETEDTLADARAIVDQTKEQLRPLSGSTVEDGAHGDGGAISGESLPREFASGGEGGSSELTLAVNGQSMTDSLKRDTELQGDGAPADDDEEKIAPLLIATIVAPNYDKEASRAMGKLERLGVEFQKRWVEQQAAEAEGVAATAETVERDQEDDRIAER